MPPEITFNMNKIICLFITLSINCFAQNDTKRSTGLIVNNAMVVSAREEASII